MKERRKRGVGGRSSQPAFEVVERASEKEKKKLIERERHFLEATFLD